MSSAPRRVAPADNDRVADPERVENSHYLLGRSHRSIVHRLQRVAGSNAGMGCRKPGKDVDYTDAVRRGTDIQTENGAGSRLRRKGRSR
jgi:hypothetical protein